jgi:hypothetical protein
VSAIRRTHPIAAPADAVWAAVSTPGHLADCHPFCERNPVSVWPGVGARDEIHYLSGWIYERRFVEWVDGAGYDLEIGSRGGPTSFVSWRIDPRGPDSCSLSISIRPHKIERGPVGLRWLLQLTYVRRMLHRYLDSVVRGVEWYVARGEPVSHDQFGVHPWFSAAAQP